MNTIKLVNQSQPRSRPRSPSSLPLSDDASTLSQQPPVNSTSFPALNITSHSLSDVPVQLQTPSMSESSSTSSVPFPGKPTESLTPTSADDFADVPLMMLSEIFTTRERMASALLMDMTFIISTSLTSFLDKLLPYMLSSTLTFHTVTNVVRTAKRNLFPNGYPAPAPPDPSIEEQAIMLQRLVSLKPKGSLVHIMPLLLGPEPSSTLAAALEPLSNAACNVHLVIFILDTVLLALFPELGGLEADGK